MLRVHEVLTSLIVLTLMSTGAAKPDYGWRPLVEIPEFEHLKFEGEFD